MNVIYSRQRKEYECWIFLTTGKVLRTYCESLTLKNVKACYMYFEKRGKYIYMATCKKVKPWNIHMFKLTFFLQCSPEVCQSSGRRFRWKTRFYGQEVMQLHNWSFGGISECIESVGWRPDSSLFSVLLDTTISQAEYFMSIEYICHH